MSDRKDSYFLQLVDEAFFDACFDDLENADRALAVDMGFIGIVSGIVATQHSPTPDLTIDITAGVSYDQAGRRCEITSAENGFDCSVDENAASTAVSTPGNERWISVQIRFDRTLAGATVDGNGNTVYTDQDESYELAVVMAGEYAIGTNTKPALPSDGRLICDIQLVNAQTQILNADIYTDRRQDFSIFSAGDIPVTSGGWTFLVPATDDIQATFDFIDARILYLDASREMSENLIPNAAGRDLGRAGNEWDLFLEKLTPSATATVDGDLIPETDGNDLGESSTPKQWSLYADFINLKGNLNLDGQIITSAGSRVNGNLIPQAGTEDLGSSSLRWDLFGNTLTVYTAIAAAAGGEAIGSAGNQFVGHLSHLTLYGAIASRLEFDSAKTVTVMVPINEWINLSGTDWAWNSTKTDIECTVAARTALIYFNLPHGASLESMRIRWSQSAGTGMTAQIESLDEDNAATSVGSAKTIGTITGSTVWEVIDSSLGEAVDRSSEHFRVKVTTVSGSVTHKVYQLEVTYTVSDILQAALYNVTH